MWNRNVKQEREESCACSKVYVAWYIKFVGNIYNIGSKEVDNKARNRQRGGQQSILDIRQVQSRVLNDEILFAVTIVRRWDGREYMEVNWKVLSLDGLKIRIGKRKRLFWVVWFNKKDVDGK